MGLPQLWQYFHKMDGNVCLQWTVPHPSRPDNQFKQVSFAPPPVILPLPAAQNVTCRRDPGGGCAGRMSWRVPVLNHRCCFCADVSPLNMRMRFCRAPGLGSS